MRGHVHPAECDGLGEMPGPVPETLTSIHNKTGWSLLFWHYGQEQVVTRTSAFSTVSPTRRVRIADKGNTIKITPGNSSLTISEFHSDFRPTPPWAKNLSRETLLLRLSPALSTLSRLSTVINAPVEQRREPPCTPFIRNPVQALPCQSRVVTLRATTKRLD